MYKKCIYEKKIALEIFMILFQCIVYLFHVCSLGTLF